MTRALAADPRIGTELAGYRIEAVLGRGGMSVVYLAEDLALGRKVALKLMAPELAEDRRFRERFRRESRLAASLDHPNVIPIYEAGEAEGLLYIAMRYVEGTDLRSLLVGEAPLAPTRSLALLSQVAEALDTAHARGLVHRDVKPSNILLAGEEDHEHVYLADFGLTKTTGSSEEGTESVRLSGTADYVAPEQITAGISDASSDVYSLGCVLYQCLTGQVPYPRENEFAVLWAHVDEPPPPPSKVRPELPGALDAVVAKALAKEPDERHRTAHELIEEARTAFPEHRRRGRHLALTGGIAALLLVGALVVALILTRGGRETATEPTLDLAAGALQRIDPETNELAATIRLGGEPVDVAAGAGAVWVVDAEQQTVARIDPQTNAVARRNSVLGRPGAVSATPASLWIASDGPAGAVLTRVDREETTTEETPLRSTLGTDDESVPEISVVDEVATTKLANGRLAIWISDLAAGTLTRVRPGVFGRPPHRSSVEVRSLPLAPASSGDELWVGHEDGLDRLDFSGRGSTVPLPFTPSAIAIDSAGIWAAGRERQGLWLVDPATGSSERVSVEGHVDGLATGAGSVWALDGEAGLVRRIDPTTRKAVAAVEVGANPVSLAVSEDGVWVAVRGDAPRSLAAFPRRYLFGLGLEHIQGAAPGARCGSALEVEDCTVLVSGPSLEGPTARVRIAFREQRVEGGSVRCGGRAYEGPVTSDVRGVAGLGRIDVDGWGTVALRLDRVLAAYPSRVFPAEPFCMELHGSWIGAGGPVEGESGRFTKVIPGELVLE